MYFVYILQSSIDDSYYIGYTKDLAIRLQLHNKGRVKSTKGKLPWKLIYQEEYKTKQEAYRRELIVKSYKGGQAFKKLLIL